MAKSLKVKVVDTVDAETRKVLKEATRLLQKARVSSVLDDSIYLGGYENGREHGFSLVYHSRGGRAVSFARFRRSDATVVYFGTTVDFDNAQIPNDATYRRAVSYSPGQWKRAGAAIAAFLLSDEEPKGSYGVQS